MSRNGVRGNNQVALPQFGPTSLCRGGGCLSTARPSEPILFDRKGKMTKERLKVVFQLHHKIEIVISLVSSMRTQSLA